MKKLPIQPSFASLTEAELEQLACDIQRETFAAVLERIRKPRSEGGLDLHFASKSPLERLLDKKNKLDLLNARLCTQSSDHKKLTLSEFNAITSGDSGPCGEHRASKEVHNAILDTVHYLVTSGENTPHQLLALQRLADFPARADLREQTAAIRAERLQLQREKEQRAKEMHAHKIALDLRREERAARKEERCVEVEAHKLKRDGEQGERSAKRLEFSAKRLEIGTKRLGLSAKSLAFRRRQHKERMALARERNEKDSRGASKNSAKNSDHLGRFARDWKGVGERVCNQFQISPEEEARRAELHKRWKQPHARPGIPSEINPVED